MSAEEMREMMRQGWQPIEEPSCTGKVDKDGRPVCLFFWYRSNNRTLWRTSYKQFISKLKEER